MIERPSPNFDARPEGQEVDILLLHYTGMKTAAEALARLVDPAAKVSAHYLIDEDGAVHRLVDETKRAWHAGVASWDGAKDINGRSVGIELVNPGHEWGYRPFTEAQYLALTDLGGRIRARHPIPPWRVLGHSDVAPERKRDPGEKFDWARLSAYGLGLWPIARRPKAWTNLEEGGEGAAVAALQGELASFGYGIVSTGRFGAETRLVVEALQRHFRPARIDGVADSETVGILRALLTARDRGPRS
ncbi:MAG: N-acetylmuramoyl-L-alanine amidase [Alphaproteobacteria bacterium]|nr:N-acetylmuramoyl-L-alanine amidase [Alphaproteobacteria bacterium]